MATIESICNKALSHLGHSKRFLTTTLADEVAQNDEIALELSVHYASVLERVLFDYPWRFAKSWMQLAAPTVGDVTVDAWASKWPFRYPYPAGIARIRRFITAKGADVQPQPPFEVADDGAGTTVLYTVVPEELARVEVTLAITDPARFDAAYESAVSWLLASEVAVALTGDTLKRDDALKNYISAIEFTRRSDAIERQPARNVPSGLERARW